MKNTTSKTLELTISAMGEELKGLIEISEKGNANEADHKNMAILTKALDMLKFFNPQFFN